LVIKRRRIKMTIEADNAGKLFDTKSLNKKVPFPRKGKPKSIALSGEIK
jgi:hypothetical protein